MGFLRALTFGLTLFVAMSWASSQAQAQRSDGIDLSLVPNDAVMAVVAFPRQIMMSEAWELFPRELLTMTAMQEFGVDPLHVERLISFAPAPDSSGFPRFGVIGWFSQPQELSDWKIVGGELTTLNQLPAIDIGGGTVWVVQLEEDMLIIGDGKSVNSMLERPRGDSRLKQLAANADQIGDVNLYVDYEAVADMSDLALRSMPLPPEFAPIADIAGKLSSVVGHAELRGANVTLTLKMGAKSDEHASQIAAVVEALADTLRGSITVAIRGYLDAEGEGPFPEAMNAYALRAADIVASHLAPLVEGDQVSVQVSSPPVPGLLAAGLLLPAVQAAREAAQRVQSMNNLKQIAIAIHNYHDVHKKLPAVAIVDDEGNPLLSWRVALLPYLDEAELYERFHLDEPWDSEHNLALAEELPRVYQSSTRSTKSETHYLLPVGSATMFPESEEVAFRDVTDGLSNTLMVVEASPEMAVTWTQPKDLKVDEEWPKLGLGGLRDGVFLACLGDGSVQAVANAIDSRVLWRMFTKAAGEDIGR